MKKHLDAWYEKVRDMANTPVDLIYTAGCTAHFHHQIEILYVKKGKITARINDVEREMGEGEVCISESYDIHTYIIDDLDNTVGIVAIISNIFLPESKAYTNKVLKENFIGTEKASTVIELLDILERNFDTAGEQLRSGLCQSILGAIYDVIPTVSKPENAKTFFMREVLLYIHANYSQDIKLEALSKKFGFNPTHFSRIFNSFIPGGLKEYLNKVRAVQAANLIKNGSTVDSAAAECGFMSIETFYRAFKKCFGLPPLVYLSSQKNKFESEFKS